MQPTPGSWKVDTPIISQSVALKKQSYSQINFWH